MSGHDIVVIGGSAGALQTLFEIARHLPRDVPASVMVAIHTAPDNPGLLPRLLGRMSAMSVAFAKDGDRLKHGHIYVAPPDRHLLVTDKGLSLTNGPRENGFRPAIDPLFRSAARVYDSRVIGVVLSGGLDDGSAGLQEVKERGGLAIVEDPQSALQPSMPESAMRSVEVDHVLGARDMAPKIEELIRQPVAHAGRGNPHPSNPGPTDGEDVRPQDLPGAPSGFICPECGGSLWEVEQGKLVRYRCHVGHVYGAESLLANQDVVVEKALWTAVRALEEKAALWRRVAARVADSPLPSFFHDYRHRAQEAEEGAALIRRFLTGHKPTEERPAALSQKVAQGTRKKNRRKS